MKCPHCGKRLSKVKLKVLQDSILTVYPDGQHEVDYEAHTIRAILCPHCDKKIRPHDEEEEKYLDKLMHDTMRKFTPDEHYEIEIV